ncbi:unnamed protein product, partial [Staurois parvus]
MSNRFLLSPCSIYSIQFTVILQQHAYHKSNAQDHVSWMPGVILGICHSVCMDSAQSHFSCPGCRVSFLVSPLILYVWTLQS